MLPEQSVMQRALALETAGETQAALDLYREVALSSDTAAPERANAWFRLGVTQERLGLRAEAVESWTNGIALEGNPELSRRCAFHAACTLAAIGNEHAAAEWLRRIVHTPGEGEPTERAARWKLLAIEPASAELPETAEGRLEALLAVEAGCALARAGDLERATLAYRLAFASDALDDASKSKAELHLREASQRLALRNQETGKGQVDALHVETWHALQRDDLAAAERLAASMPAAAPETAARIGHMLVTTAFRLESAGLVDRACRLYLKAVNDDGLTEAIRCNAAYRLALLVAETDRDAAFGHLRRAVTSPDEAVHAAASLHLANYLIQAQDWAGALEVCESDRIHEPGVKDLLAIRALQCRALLARMPEYTEIALPTAVAAHAGAWMDAALACEATDKYPIARALYEHLLSAGELPRDITANVQFRLGLVLDRMMMWMEAEEHLLGSSRSPDAWPATRVHARYRLGSIYYLLDKHELAESEFDKLRSDADAEPGIRADAQLKHGMCLFKLERFEEAACDFRTCRAIGGEIEVKAELMLAEIAEARHDIAAARDSYNRLIQHAHASPLTKTAAFQRLRDLPRR